MKKYAVIGKAGVWTFFASTLEESKEFAALILSLEQLGGGNTITCVKPGVGAWKAAKLELKLGETKKLQLAKDGKGKIIKIKTKKSSPIDVIYMTRRQKEREGPAS